MGNIVWLASYPKSGNTWMRAFIHNLFRDPREPMDINRLTGSLAMGEATIGWYKLLDPRPIEEWTPESVSALRPRVHEMIAQGQEGTIFCKTHCALLNIDGRSTVNMAVTAGAIYMIRNPLDVVVSYADFQAAPIDATIVHMATEDLETPIADRNVSENLGSWSQHVKSWTERENKALHIVRYEDMLASPLKTFGGVAKFLGLKPPRQRLERAIRNSSFNVLRKQEETHGFVERPAHQERFFRKGKAGQWKDALTAEQIARICETHREQMARFGYLPEGY